jgi:hypothetical protein
MKTKLLQFGLLGLMFAAVIVGFSNGRPSNSKKSSPDIYSFFYYPKPNIYYNRDTREYAYVNPEGNWQTSKNLPYAVSLESEKKVALTGNYSEIWKNNEQHRMVYAASLYASASDLQQPAAKARPLQATAPKIVNEKKEDEKKQPGLKRFLKKIFKKKKAAGSDTLSLN